MKKTRSGPRSKGNEAPRSRSATTSSAAKPQQQTRIALLDSLDDMSDARIRLEACAAIASKFEPLEDSNREVEAKMKKEIVKLGREGMFKLLVRNSTDKDGLVSMNAIGALRNLALTGGDKAMSLMQQEDAWTALTKVVATPEEHCAGVEANVRAVFESTLRKEALSVMSAMCEWSPAVAEKRLPETLGLISICFQNLNKDVVESAAKLLYKASEANTSLGNALVSTDSGKQLGLALEKLLEKLTHIPNDFMVASAYGLGVLLNVAMCFEHQDLPGMICKWFATVATSITDSYLPSVTVNESIVTDATLFEEDDMLEEDGRNKTESDRLRAWLDLVEAQSLIFEGFTTVLRKVAREKEENSHKAAFWLQVIQPLETAGLLHSSLTFACSPWSGELSAPATLSLSVAKLQQTAGECASAAVDVFQSVSTGYLQEAAARVLKVLSDTSSQGMVRTEADERVVAYAQLVSSIVRRANQPVSVQDAEVLVRLMKECRVEAARALLSGCVGKLCLSDLKNLLRPVAQSLLEAMAQEQSLVVLGEQADALIDLFSEEDRQQVFDSLQGIQVFQEFVKQFDRRFNDLKRQEDVDLDQDDLERLAGIKSNVQEFLKWKKTI